MLRILFCGTLACALIKEKKCLQTKTNRKHCYISVIQEQKLPYALIYSPCLLQYLDRVYPQKLSARLIDQ